MILLRMLSVLVLVLAGVRAIPAAAADHCDTACAERDFALCVAGNVGFGALQCPYDSALPSCMPVGSCQCLPVGPCQSDCSLAGQVVCMATVVVSIAQRCATYSFPQYCSTPAPPAGGTPCGPLVGGGPQGGEPVASCKHVVFCMYYNPPEGAGVVERVEDCSGPSVPT